MTRATKLGAWLLAAAWCGWTVGCGPSNAPPAAGGGAGHHDHDHHGHDHGHGHGAPTTKPATLAEAATAMSTHVTHLTEDLQNEKFDDAHEHVEALESLVGHLPDLISQSELPALAVEQAKGVVGQLKTALADLHEQMHTDEPIKADAPLKLLSDSLRSLADMLDPDAAPPAGPAVD